MPASIKLPRIDYNAPFSLTFCLACLAVFLSFALSAGWTQLHVFSLDGSASLSSWSTWPRMFLHVLGHANFEHLFGNLIFLLLLGPRLEENYGWWRLTLISAITAVVTGLIMLLFFRGLLLGASGVVFALIILSSFAKARSGSIPLTFLLIAVIFLGSELYQAFQGHTDTAHFAHIAGGVIGGACGFFWLRNR